MTPAERKHCLQDWHPANAIGALKATGDLADDELLFLTDSFERLQQDMMDALGEYSDTDDALRACRRAFNGFAHTAMRLMAHDPGVLDPESSVVLEQALDLTARSGLSPEWLREQWQAWFERCLAPSPV